mmetsp:Transcript_85853/g.247770  ORF Transcript_85853/g.247770 Transcript_85853/m.247770 type:complete len:358 (-) Transcript_85853:96-1169(-)|eukprot:CAMPEP_0176095566 /NCGR_PEP_ID=MMETSP0120_2-20121206/47900_1 /TAXON_ID=160619 /ORGANISM="Kryptoperidinium foliaceum, Strain CCMP 1326" /LENGTH=357 /DNA_ID=CAMNT_0017429533 /DNA_START=94 /DNA_END=1167 /DNA_ORIENTATION=-
MATAANGNQVQNGQGIPLIVTSLNLQYFSSFPNTEAARTRLKEALKLDGDGAPDVIAVQEGISSKDELKIFGFERIVCSGEGEAAQAQTVKEMVYSDAGALKACAEDLHSELLCNQLYCRNDSKWTVVGRGTEPVSSDIELNGRGGRAQGKLVKRSMVWAKLVRPDAKEDAKEGAVYVMCTHITGGRFEDQYFVQELAEERKKQVEACIKFYEVRENKHEKDVGILVGDFNALSKYDSNGPMHAYYESSIKTSAGVKADAAAMNLDDAALEKHFEQYMVSPFTVLENCKWELAYGPDSKLITSAFGHLIDHMATSRPIRKGPAEVQYLTNQKFGNKKDDTDIVLTDHNAIQVRFLID